MDLSTYDLPKHRSFDSRSGTDNVRTIKKYPNRRLYDTKESRYITLNDIRQLVIEEEDFEVIDKKTGKTITRSVLLHVIAEQEENGDSVMSQDFLAHIIRAYNGQLPQIVRGYLEGSLRLFLEQHQKAGDTLKNLVDTEPLAAMTDLAQKNLGEWLDLQKEMLRAFRAPGGERRDTERSSGS